MSFDYATLIGDAILAGGTVAVALYGRKTANRASATHDKVAEIERRTVSDKRIANAITEYARENPGEISEALLEDALRRLLIAIIDDNYPEGTRNNDRKRN